MNTYDKIIETTKTIKALQSKLDEAIEQNKQSERYCNKCGYVGPDERHDNCGYSSTVVLDPSLEECIEIVDGYGPYGLDVNEDYRIKIALKDEVLRLRDTNTVVSEDFDAWWNNREYIRLTSGRYAVDTSYEDIAREAWEAKKIALPTAQAALDVYVRERALKAALEAAEFGCYPCDDDALKAQIEAIVNSVIEGKKGEV